MNQGAPEFLADYVTTCREKIAEWKVSDKKARSAQFGPGIRTAPEKQDGYISGQRKKISDLLSEHACHASCPV